MYFRTQNKNRAAKDVYVSLMIHSLHLSLWGVALSKCDSPTKFYNLMRNSSIKSTFLSPKGSNLQGGKTGLNCISVVFCFLPFNQQRENTTQYVCVEYKYSFSSGDAQQEISNFSPVQTCHVTGEEGTKPIFLSVLAKQLLWWDWLWDFTAKHQMKVTWRGDGVKDLQYYFSALIRLIVDK